MRNFVLEYFHNRYGLAKIANSRLAKFLISVLKADKRATQLSNKTKSTSAQVNTSSNKGTKERCACGNRFLTDSVYCRKCGSPRPGPATKQLPLLKESTHQECGCGNIFRGDSKFCRKCGRERPRVRPTAEQCGCGNLFLTDSIFCRKCGTPRPGRHVSRRSVHGNHTYHQCACGNIFAGDSLYCRKCGKIRPEELPNWRFGVFLYATGLKAPRKTAGDSQCSELLMMMLRRAFSKNIKKMSEQLGTNEGDCQITVEKAIHLIIGHDGEKKDRTTWDAPQLTRECSDETILDLFNIITNIDKCRQHDNGKVQLCTVRFFIKMFQK